MRSLYNDVTDQKGSWNTYFAADAQTPDFEAQTTTHIQSLWKID